MTENDVHVINLMRRDGRDDVAMSAVKMMEHRLPVGIPMTLEDAIANSQIGMAHCIVDGSARATAIGPGPTAKKRKKHRLKLKVHVFHPGWTPSGLKFNGPRELSTLRDADREFLLAQNWQSISPINVIDALAHLGD